MAVEMEMLGVENKHWEKEFLSRYNLDARLFEAMNLKIKQIIPVRSVFRIETDKGFYCLKRLRFSREELSFVLGAVEHLRDRGFTEIFNIVYRQDGSLFYDFEGDKYYLTEWIDGRECDYMNPVDLQCAAETLAKLHKASSGYSPGVCPESRDYLGKWPENFRYRIGEMQLIKEQVQSKKDKNEFDTMYLDYADTCMQDAEDALNMLSGTDYLTLSEQARQQKSFIHHDYAHHNIIHTFDGRTYVVDFDYCVFDIRAHDIASLILRNMKRSEWDISKADFILEAYSSISPIEKSELRVLMPFFLFPQDFWMLSRQYYIEKKPWEEQDYVDKMSKKSEYTTKRRKFLEEFARYI